ncbi:MAG: epoxyqueuosine reductase QueH [Candidatus Omnitrophica bacterium]|nr:epoxyqueuosine reductase QueH [Candidatus Omnitrophota bacterium]
MKVLLHVCCGICAVPAAERLMCEGHIVTGFFYNPNIHPVDEYKKRLAAAEKAAKELGFELIEGMYDREKWFENAKGVEYEKEGGKRCERCFYMRLARTYDYMKRKNFDMFATTLSAGPMKNVEVINSIGRSIGGEKFFLADFKKKGGAQRGIELAKEWNLYRQDYCGCIYSLEEKFAREKARDEGR